MMKQYEGNADTQFHDFKHHLSTMKTTQLSGEEFSLLCTRLTYQLDRLNNDIQSQTRVLTHKIKEKLDSKAESKPDSDTKLDRLPVISRAKSYQIVPKTSQPQPLQQAIPTKKFQPTGHQTIEKMKKFYPSSAKLEQPAILKSQSSAKIKPLVKPGRIGVPAILPKEFRRDPFADPPPITDKDLQKGVMALMQSGIIPKDVDISTAFKRGGDLVSASTMSITLIDPKHLKFLRVFTPQENFEKYKLDAPSQPTIEVPRQINGIDLDPGLFLTSPGVEHGEHHMTRQQGQARRTKDNYSRTETIQQLMQRTKVLTLEISNSHIQEQDDSYRQFKVEYLPIWGGIKHIIRKLEGLTDRFGIQKAKIDGLKVMRLASGLTRASIYQLIGCFLNQELVISCYKLTRKQYLNKKERLSLHDHIKRDPKNQKDGEVSAAVRIQAVARMFVAKRKYKSLLTRIMKVIRIQKQFKLQQMYKNTILRIQQRFVEVKSNQKERQQTFLQSYKRIQQSHRIEVHLPSFSIDYFQRLTMSHFRHREAVGLLRLFQLRDPNLEIIFISPLEPNEEVIQYFNKVLEVSGIPDAMNRLHIVYPENTNRFPYSCSLGKLLYFSPKALYQIKQIVTGKTSYLVPMRVGNEDFLIAEYLGICVLSPPAEIVQEITKKSVSKEIFKGLNLPISPGASQIKSREEFIDRLTVLIAKHLYVSRWIFKIDTEFNGRGTASFTLEGIKQFTEVRKSPEVNEHVVATIRNLVTALLPLKTSFAFPSLYTNFDDYLIEFLRSGGIIEAYPFLSSKKSLQQDETVGSVNLLFIIEPSGQISLTNSSDSIVINEFVSVGQVYPQSSIPNLNQEALVQRLGEELYSRGVWGCCTLSLLTFSDSKPSSHLFWCRRIRLGMDENFCAVNLSELLSLNQDVGLSINNSMADMANELAGVGQQRTFMHLPLLYHPGLQAKKYKDLFTKCRTEGISFDMERKTGTLLLLCDEIQSGVISIITIRETHRKTVRLMTDALNFLLHFAGTVVKMQNDNLRTDIFYFVDIVQKVRQINKDHELNQDQKVLLPQA